MCVEPLLDSYSSEESSIAKAISIGAVISEPHFGQGAETPARWVGTRSFTPQCAQVNLIFFTFFRRIRFSLVVLSIKKFHESRRSAPMDS